MLSTKKIFLWLFVIVVLAAIGLFVNFSYKVFKYTATSYQLFEGEHLISVENQSLSKKEIFRINVKTGKTDILISQVANGKRINLWLPVFETKINNQQTKKVEEVKKEEIKK